MKNAKHPSPPADAAGHSTSRLLQIITDLSDGVILLGSGRTIAWANDAALAMHGVDSLHDLGHTVDEYRARFELRYRNNHPVEPDRYPLERLLDHEKFADVIVEVRAIGAAAGEEDDPCRFHDLRSVVLDEDGEQPGSLALVIRDETERFRAEERFESVFNANPAPALICRLADRRYIKANPGFLEMTGLLRPDVVEHSFDQLDVLTNAEDRDLALERMDEGRPIPQMEATVPLPGERLKYVIVAGEPIVVGDEPCMLFTFADLDRSKEVESALRKSEERFAKSFRLSPAPAMICRLDGLELVEVNDAFETMAGQKKSELLGHRAVDLDLWADGAARKAFVHAATASSGVQNLDLALHAHDGAPLNCLVSTDQVEIHGVVHVICVMQDITDRKRTEEELVAAIEAVMTDSSWFGRSVVERLALLRCPSHSRRLAMTLEELTNREREVLGLICEGFGNREMSKLLNLSPNTVRNHVSSLYQKLAVNSRSAVIIWGRERGITGRDEAMAAGTR